MKNNKNSNNANFKNVAKNFFRKEDAFLVPNILCYLRVLLVIAFMICYLIPFEIHGNELAHIYIATGIMMSAAYSDFIDGYIARTFDQKSELGKVLDPIADKLLQLGIIIVLVIKYHSSVYVCLMFGIFLSKEITLFFEDLLMARRNTSFDGAKWYGKVSSFVFYVVTCFILLVVPFFNLGMDINNQMIIIDVCCSIATFCLILAWVMYFLLFLKLMKKANTPSTEKKTTNLEDKKHD